MAHLIWCNNTKRECIHGWYPTVLKTIHDTFFLNVKILSLWHASVDDRYTILDEIVKKKTQLLNFITR